MSPPDPVALEAPAEPASEPTAPPPGPPPTPEPPPTPPEPPPALPASPTAPVTLPAPPDPSVLPIRGQRRSEDHWDVIDRHGVAISRAGLTVQLASTVVLTTGLVFLGNDALGDRTQAAGIALTGLGTVGALGGGSLYLLGFGRSERGMRERGVRVGDGLLPTSWIVYGSAAPFAPLFVAAPPTFPIWSIAVMGLGAGVGTHQRRVRDEADLPPLGSPWAPPLGVAVSGPL